MSAHINGFNTSSDLYYGQVCIGDPKESDVGCQLKEFYVINEIYDDYQLYNFNAGYGTIGLGPMSPVWQKFTDPQTNEATYFIALSWNETEAKTNVTLGGKPSDVALGAANLTLNAHHNTTAYDLNDFKFGKIYYDENNEPESAFFASLFDAVEDYNITFDSVFSVSYQGLGLPTPLYDEFTRLLALLDDNIICNDTL